MNGLKDIIISIFSFFFRALNIFALEVRIPGRIAPEDEDKNDDAPLFLNYEGTFCMFS